MKFKSLLHTKILEPRNLVLIFGAVAVLMVTSAVIELRNSRQELYSLMEEQSLSLLETILITSNNALNANQHLEELMSERLLDNAYFVQTLYSRGELTRETLASVVSGNHLSQVMIVNESGEAILSSREDAVTESVSAAALNLMAPIFNGEQDTVFIGMQINQTTGSPQYQIALATAENLAILVTMDAADIMEFRRQIGFGGLMRRFVDNEGIVYVALQDYSGIIAASGNVEELEALESSPFLERALLDSTYVTRINEFDSSEVYETVHPFYYQGYLVGIFRLGLSLDPLEAINARIFRRIAIITVALLGIGFLAFSAILIRQNMQILERQYQVVETYSNTILQEIQDGILVYDDESGIKIYNQAARQIFHVENQDVLGKSARKFLTKVGCAEILRQTEPVREIQCMIRERIQYLLISKTNFTDDNEIKNTVLVIRDLTEQKQLEEQVQRRERLSAMGELASGVAHEIRNPLNTIGMIIQQLDSDFLPEDDIEEYHKLNQLVYKEVRRVNETIKNFLRFARPEAMEPEPFSLKEFMEGLVRQYKPLAEKDGIALKLDLTDDYDVVWDQRQIQQVFLNLIQNAIDAMESSGKIELSANQIDPTSIELQVKDTGPGIPEEVRGKIFNLYFTTKPQGTGIGLGLVQRIIYEHGGTISVESTEGRGTTFTIHLPLNVQTSKQSGIA